MSSSDMWQPKQPQSDTVAILGFAMRLSLLLRRRRIDFEPIGAWSKSRRPTGRAKPRRFAISAPVGQAATA